MELVLTQENFAPSPHQQPLEKFGYLESFLMVGDLGHTQWAYSYLCLAITPKGVHETVYDECGARNGS